MQGSQAVGCIPLVAGRWVLARSWQPALQLPCFAHHCGQMHVAYSLPCSWTHEQDGPPAAGTPARARQCQYLFERALHSMLQAALAAEEAARGKAGRAAWADGSKGRPDAKDGGQDSINGLSAAERGCVVESVLEDVEYQLGLVHACIEASFQGLCWD